MTKDERIKQILSALEATSKELVHAKQKRDKRNIERVRSVQMELIDEWQQLRGIK